MSCQRHWKKSHVLMVGAKGRKGAKEGVSHPTIASVPCQRGPFSHGYNPRLRVVLSTWWGLRVVLSTWLIGGLIDWINVYYSKAPQNICKHLLNNSRVGDSKNIPESKACKWHGIVQHPTSITDWRWERYNCHDFILTTTRIPII